MVAGHTLLHYPIFTSSCVSKSSIIADNFASSSSSSQRISLERVTFASCDFAVRTLLGFNSIILGDMMPNASADPLSLRLDEKLTHLSGTHFEPYIYKIHDRLRRQSEKAYEPEILSIGPYHHGKGSLRMMEEHKLLYLQLLLKRTDELSVDSMSPGPERFLKISYGVSTDDVKHYLDLVHHITSSSFAKFVSKRNIPDMEKRWDYIRCATELHEAGIRFKKAKHTPLFDIKFINGAIEIPQFAVEEKTDTIFRNLIAHEEHLRHAGPKCITDYLTFLCCLINSAKDVSLLRRCGILNNMLGDDEAVSAFFSKASTCVFVSRGGFCYYEVFRDINVYCKCRHNVWTAKLRRDYFNSPWKIISFLGVVFLLLLSFAQTMLSGLAYLCQK
ncbi:hypothetical protein Vadar_021239 [Vaccinium darrowii]|uniref:Uncharacterized protein n=1 Tax=Vaccinium darrowii TaxID=229202 RepID=A0ACB7YY67_9ERIC|nr:hypothetical protein Vadar_021239 [Vaccinium darrowii]